MGWFSKSPQESYNDKQQDSYTDQQEELARRAKSYDRKAANAGVASKAAKFQKEADAHRDQIQYNEREFVRGNWR